MNPSTLKGILIGVTAALSVGAIAGYQAMSGPDYAQVVGVTPVKQAEKRPEQQCEMVQVVHRRPVKDEHQLLGTAVGAVLGGVVGHQIGGGRGRDVATVAGAAAGGYAGNRIQKNAQDRDTYTTQERRCRTVDRMTERVVGYDVEYTLAGRPGKVRMDHEPGARIPVRDGQLVLDAPAPSADRS